MPNPTALSETPGSMNFDIVVNILSFTNVGSINITLICLAHVPGSTLSPEELKKAREYRLSPIVYLSDLVSDPQCMLNLMKDSNAVLGGSRAAAYFSPGLTTLDSDWDFYCSRSTGNPHLFIDGIIEMGAVFVNFTEDYGIDSVPDPSWSVSDGRPSIPNNRGMGQVALNFEVPFKRGSKLQLVVHRSELFFIPFLDYDLSCLQCIFMPDAAVSLYHSLTSQNKAIWWDEWKALDAQKHAEEPVLYPEAIHPHDIPLARYTKLMRHKEKYVLRGIEILTPNAAQDFVIPNNKMRMFMRNGMRSVHRRKRTVTDKGSLIVYFNDSRPSLENIKWSDGIAPLGCSTAIEF